MIKQVLYWTHTAWIILVYAEGTLAQFLQGLVENFYIKESQTHLSK